MSAPADLDGQQRDAVTKALGCPARHGKNIVNGEEAKEEEKEEEAAALEEERKTSTYMTQSPLHGAVTQQYTTKPVAPQPLQF